MPAQCAKKNAVCDAPNAAHCAKPTVASRLACVLLVVATVAAYSNTLRCPFVLDDEYDIVANRSIRHLWPIRDVFYKYSQGREILHSRPVVNLSLAVNYATGGLDTLHYHLTNLAIHVLAGLTLFGIVRRTLCLPSLRDRYGGAATPLAFVVAAVWTLHPLETQAVTYLIQRFESLMGLFYLLALYCALRHESSARPGWWAAGCVAACLLSMGSKEVAVSIPLVILLYDRAFMAGSFVEAWRRRRGMYLGLAGAWVAMAVHLAVSGGRGHWAGFGLSTSPLDYAKSQFGVILHYLQLSFWPHPQVFDYRWPIASTAGQIVPGLLVVGGLLAATVFALIRWPKWGTLGAWFFLILAPTSSVMPIADLAFEHRMYLSLAAVVVLAVIAGHAAMAWLALRLRLPPSAAKWATALLAGAVIAALGATTYARNRVYRSDEALWTDVVQNAPDNARGYVSLGTVLVHQDRIEEAFVQYQTAQRLDPRYADCYIGLASVLGRQGKYREAAEQCRKALELEPQEPLAHYDLASILCHLGNFAEAAKHYQAALQLDPHMAGAYAGLGNVLAKQGRLDDAAAAYEKALELAPDLAEARMALAGVLGQQGKVDQAIALSQEGMKTAAPSAPEHHNLGALLERQGKTDEAMQQYRKALEIDPRNADSHYNLANCLASQGRADEAVAEYVVTLKIRPRFVEARYNLANTLARQEKYADALAQYQKAQEIDPRFASAYIGAAAVLSLQGKPDEAVAQSRKLVEIAPQSADAVHHLAGVLARQGKLEAAVVQFQKALAIQPDFVEARFELGRVYYLQGKGREAAAQWKEALRLRPTEIALLNVVAWEWSTCPNGAVRNGAEAVKLAQQAVELSGGQAPELLDTQAAAYAETGRFAEAVATAQRALGMASARGNAPLAEALRGRITLYEAKSPFRDPRSPLASPPPPSR